MNILLVGMNHRTAPVDLREQMAFSPEGTATALMLFGNRYPDYGALLLSTCNRTEFIVVSEKEEPTVDSIVRFMAEARDLPVDQFRNCLYWHRGERAVRHLFRVASGLDSMVLGEYQIVSQLKQAYAQASERGTSNSVLNRLLHNAFHVSKRVREETEIGLRKVSIPSVAVDYAKRVLDDFSDKRVLVVGAGDMAQLVCEHLRELNVKEFTVTSRTLNNARALANACDGRCVPYEDLDHELARSDIVITAVRCPKAILTTERITRAQAARRHRLLYIVDLGVPRNVEKEVDRLTQVYLLDIDALGKTVAENQAARQREAHRGEHIVEEEVQAFDRWLNEREVKPLISQMYADARLLRDLELERTLNACEDLTDKQRRAIEQLADRLLNKLMHPYVSTTREHCFSAPVASLVQGLHEVSAKQAKRKINGKGRLKV